MGIYRDEGQVRPVACAWQLDFLTLGPSPQFSTYM